MALCVKCLIGSGGSGGGLLPAESARFRVELQFEPMSDEAEGVRNVVFEGDVTAGDPLDGVSAEGVLVGNFGLSADDQLEQQATVETYSRNGSLALITLVVRDESGQPTFSAHLTPVRADAAIEDVTLDAQIFMGRPAGITAD